MNSSLKRRSLSKPEKGTEIDPFDLAYVRGRNKNKAHSMLLEVFGQSGLTKAELARALKKKPEQITRLLAGPGNLTLNTLSDLVFALNGEFLSIQGVDELSKARSNCTAPNWLVATVDAANLEGECRVRIGITEHQSIHTFHSPSQSEFHFVAVSSGGKDECFEQRAD